MVTFDFLQVYLSLCECTCFKCHFVAVALKFPHRGMMKAISILFLLL